MRLLGPAAESRPRSRSRERGTQMSGPPDRGERWKHRGHFPGPARQLTSQAWGRAILWERACATHVHPVQKTSPSHRGRTARTLSASRRSELYACMKTETTKCPECGAGSLFATTTKANGTGAYGPHYLGGLGTPVLHGLIQLDQAKFQVVVCAECGLTRFYADAESRAKLPKTDNWQRI